MSSSRQHIRSNYHMKSNTPPENTYLTVEQVAKRFNVSIDTI